MRLRFGPGAVVAAAFIGPGTVTTCTLAGANFGHALLWALAFATIGTLVLQEMSARLGVVGGVGLGEAIRRRFERADLRPLRTIAALLVVAAIGFGNAAYQTGNLLGAALGAEITVPIGARIWVMVFAAVAAALLWTGSYRAIERVLVSIVAAMALCFVITAVAVGTGGAGAFAVLRGLLVPSAPEGSGLVALGLVGTTIVPYNLYLHSSAAKQRWHGAGDLRTARADLMISIVVGGLVSMAIVITAAAHRAAVGGSGAVAGAADMAAQLEPLLGQWATYVFAAGFAAAGLTSAITAPLAAAFALSGVLGWDSDLRARGPRTVWIAVLAIGATFAIAGVRPVPAILFAQAANGVLLPATALFLLFVMNDRQSLGQASNGLLANLLGITVVGLTVILGARALIAALT